MYDAFTGRKGSGKSYNVVRTVILDALRRGRTVVTNIPLTEHVALDPELTGRVVDFDINEIDDSFFDPENVIKGAVYVLDEVHEIWPSGMMPNEFPPHTKQFITKHRHMIGEINGKPYSTDLVLVTQCISNVASYARKLLDSTYRCKKMDKLGHANEYKVFKFDGPVTLDAPKSIEPLVEYKGTYDESVFRYYESQTLNDTSYDSGLEEVSEETIWKNKLFTVQLPLVAVFSVLALYFVYWVFMDRFGDPEEVQQSDYPAEQVQFSTEENQPSDTQQPQSQPQIQSYKELGFSTVYRLAFLHVSTSQQQVVITDNTNFFPIPISSCQPVPVYGLTCNFFGELVNKYSGVQPHEEGVSSGLFGS